MEVFTGDFNPVQSKLFPARDGRKTAEDRYWRRFKAPVTAQEVGAVTSIEFSAEKPYQFAVTASTRVVVYNAASRKVARTYARFKDKAYSGSFRSDGKLLVAGGEDGIVQIFEAGSRTLLRQLKGHQRPVRVAKFSPDKIHVLSAGDDATVRYWDITSGEQVCRLDGHTDYVRAAAVNPANSNLWATGGYDHSCKLWDVSDQQERLSVDHGSPIEAVAFVPSGALLITAGGTEVKIWDVLGGTSGRLVARLQSFSKTVTSLAISSLAGPDSAASGRLLVGSLDGHVKVFDIERFRLQHVSKYPSAVLSLGLAGDARTLAVGLADGTLSIRRHSRKRPPGVTEEDFRRPKKRRPLDARDPRYALRGASEKAAPGDLVVEERRRAPRLKPADVLLKSFQHRDALDAALRTQDPAAVLGMLEELAYREDGLDTAIGGREEPQLLLLLNFINRHMQDVQYARPMVQLMDRVLDMYASEMGRSEALRLEFERSRAKIREEEAVLRRLMRMQGSLAPILTAAAPIQEGF